jgi:hypothetical protein
VRSPQTLFNEHGPEQASSYNPPVMVAQGSNELVDFSMAFLTSTWYITNPYLKSKLITVRRTIVLQVYLLMSRCLNRLSLLVSGGAEEAGLVS